MKYPIGIVGARGYAGLELVKAALKHPHMDLTACFSRDSSWDPAQDIAELTPGQVPVLPLDDLETTDLETLFLATPVDVSMALAQTSRAKVVIDLSGAFRLPVGTFETAYHTTHHVPDLIEDAAFGIAPFSNEGVGAANLIANSGCYVSSVLMALLPLARAGIGVLPHPVIDAKSGVSGAGRAPKEYLLLSEMQGNFYPYKVGRHQHRPEIIYQLKSLGDLSIDPRFTTQLLPTHRGISTAIYAETTEPVAAADVAAALEAAYGNYPLARWTVNEEDGRLLHLAKVAHTPYTHLSYFVEGTQLTVFSVIDNLMKGAATGAIENWNVRHGLTAEEGLL